MGQQTPAVVTADGGCGGNRRLCCFHRTNPLNYMECDSGQKIFRK